MTNFQINLFSCSIPHEINSYHSGSSLKTWFKRSWFRNKFQNMHQIRILLDSIQNFLLHLCTIAIWQQGSKAGCKGLSPSTNCPAPDQCSLGHCCINFTNHLPNWLLIIVGAEVRSVVTKQPKLLRVSTESLRVGIACCFWMELYHCRQILVSIGVWIFHYIQRLVLFSHCLSSSEWFGVPNHNLSFQPCHHQNMKWKIWMDELSLRLGSHWRPPYIYLSSR